MNRLDRIPETIYLFKAAHRLLLAAERVRRLDCLAWSGDGSMPQSSIDRLWTEWASEQLPHLPGLQTILSQGRSNDASLSTSTISEPKDLCRSVALIHLRTFIDAINFPHLHESLLGRQVTEEDRIGLSMLSEAAQTMVQSIVDRVRFEQATERATQQAIYDFAYGLTHEINNPLANIAARAQQLLAQATSAADQKSLATIVDQSMRAHEMLAEMMRAVKPKHWNPTIVLLADCLQSLLTRFRSAFQARQIEFEVEGDFEGIAISTESSEFRDAIGSLLQNALDACSPSDSVVLSAQAWGDSVDLSVKDTGCGMSQQAVENAFSLYFSGREHGRGLGISLANVRRVVDAMRGEISLTSGEGIGTQVRIRVPVASMPPSKRGKRIRIES
ncbi:MAG: HAMP domain-containing histidine kinase [Pirellula sp.]|nr:HAMP domain-containing histidine kinase [Pirellula sp.]